MIKQNQRVLNTILIIIDVVVYVISFLIAWYLKFESGIFEPQLHFTFRTYVQTLLFTLPALLIIEYIFELYTPQRRKYLHQEIVNITKSNIALYILIISVLYIIKKIHISRALIILLIIINIILSSIERGAVRVFLRSIRTQGYNRKYVLVIGGGRLGREYLKAIEKNKYLGYSPIGVLDDNEKRQGKKIINTEIIGRISDLEQILVRYRADEAIIALPLQAYPKLKNIIETCEKAGVKTLVIPDYIRYMPAKPYFDEIEELPLLNTRYVPLDHAGKKIMKRIFDIIVSTIALILLAPIMLFFMIAIKINSPGPAIFKQERVGFHRKKFIMYKFRTMKTQSQEQSDEQWTTKDDDRRTKIGEFLRKTSLDELPQLINVIKGDMSIIGPRPERPYFVEQFKGKIPKYMIKHHVRPGLTGWAQVNGWRGDTSIKERIKHDIYYIENWSFMFDIRILFLTILRGFVNKNAY